MDEDVGLQTSVPTRADAIRTGGRGETKMAPRVPLGDELPLFCEKCGYSLHGMPPVRCDHCTLLQFHCPECGHHQPINTLRPAAHRILGRLRATALGWSILFKLNFFGWLLFAWGAMGTEWSYSYQHTPQFITTQQLTITGGNLTVQGGGAGGTLTLAAPTFAARPIDLEAIIAHVLFALVFGIFARMLLLRWRRAWAIGLILGGLVFVAYVLGVWFRYWELTPSYTIGQRFGVDHFQLALISGATVVLGAVVAWPIWVGLTKLFLPKRAATSLLDWQRSLSDPSSLARQ